MEKAKPLFQLLSFSLLISLFSCSGGNQEKDDRTVFRYNESAGISSLDPAFAKDLPNIWACNQIYNGLVSQDSNLEVIPAIASRWEILENGKLYRFTLRQDVYFHSHELFGDDSTRHVTADDFEYSFKRILDPGTASPGSWVFRNVSSREGKPAITAINDTTLEIRLDHPFPPFLGILSMQYCSVVAREAIEYFGDDFRQHPIGTGPFKFKMWKEGIKLVLVKNQEYFEMENGARLPYLDAVAVTFLIDKQSAFLEFVKGGLDFISGLDPSYKDEILTPSGHLNPKYNDRIRLITEPYLNTEYLGILVSDEGDPESPLKNKNFRKAINYGFDREKMMKYLRNGIGTPGQQGIIPKGMQVWSQETTGYHYDPALARKYLVEAGFDHNTPVPTVSLYTTAEYLDLCEYIQHQLGDLGIRLDLEVTPSGTLRELKANSRIDFFRASWVADYPDEENYLSLFYSKNFSPDGPNYTHFSHPGYDSLYEISQRTLDKNFRDSLYRKMESIMIDEAPVVILYYDQVLRFVRKNVSGIGSNPMNLLDLKRVRKD